MTALQQIHVLQIHLLQIHVLKVPSPCFTNPIQSMFYYMPSAGHRLQVLELPWEAEPLQRIDH